MTRLYDWAGDPGVEWQSQKGYLREPDGSEGYYAELDRQAELDREALATEREDFDELVEAEPDARHAFDGNRYLGLLSPHSS
jgi:hypothetical protein